MPAEKATRPSTHRTLCQDRRNFQWNCFALLSFVLPWHGGHMLPGWLIILSALAYILLLFAVASYGDRRSRRFGVAKGGRPMVYALSLAIYCTSWTYFGSVGLASQHGLEFTGIYIGPILAFTLGMPIIRQIGRAHV